MTSIEIHLYSTDPYHATSAPNPLPYPVEHIPVDEFNTKLQAQLEQIKNLLQQYNLPPKPHNISVTNLSKPGYPHGEARPTIIIEYKGPMLETFKKAKDGLAGLSFEVDRTPMDVEIVHHEYRFRPSLFPISPGHPGCLCL